MKSIFNIVVVATILGFLFVSSCKEDIVPTIAEIRVVSQDGEPIPNADITLTCTSSVNRPCEVEIMGKADKNGVFTHEFNLPKVLLVSAAGNIVDSQLVNVLPDTQWIITKDTICGFTTISIKPEQTSVQTVILYDCK